MVCSFYDDFQPSQYFSNDDSEDNFYPRELEAAFCRDFSCCGLVLEDLHDLLQHYEECHVRFEEDDSQGNFYEDEWSSDNSAPNSPQLANKQIHQNSINAMLKKKAAATFSDFYSDDMGISHDDSSAFDTSILRTPQTVKNSKKRNHAQFAASTLDMTPVAKKMALPPSLAAQSFADLPSGLSDEDFLAQAGALFMPTSANGTHRIPHVSLSFSDPTPKKRQPNSKSSPSPPFYPASLSAADKPYKCPVTGCDKAYKNPNGLKYHNQHGHCNTQSAVEGDKPCMKPYQCTIGDCGKRYKNLNGLKYHIEHAHIPAINTAAALAGVGLPSPLSTPMSSPIGSPIQTPLSPPLN
ncbi:hypothetical protein BC936DRAFT_143963 [Jimgerdemannia flammicorona]|uniref:C2H2-type domain-containing protein n=1 Tax=Jimgerdemannia flammicorona TaxID=994334 RepID=A0A432ZYR7_9FUNG|nr:hypothetical protein BC936DRAFT_143963 [Jimgerdemannia flammicorona]